MPSNDQEVFRYLSSDDTNSDQVALLAFSLFFLEKEEWCSQYEETHKSAPAQDEINKFTQDYTNQRLDRLKNDAAVFFDAAARAYLNEEIESDKERILETAIVQEVRRAGSFWRQFGMAVITSILAPLILALILLVAAYVKYIPSPNDLASKVFPRFEQQPAH